MGRFAERPEAGFVAQDTQPGIVRGAAIGVSFEKAFEAGNGLRTAVDVAQFPDQGELGIAGLGESRHGKPADFEGDFVVPALTIGPGEFQPHLDVVGLGGHPFAQEAQFAIPVSRIDGIPHLPVPGAHGYGGGSVGLGDLGLMDTGNRERGGGSEERE